MVAAAALAAVTGGAIVGLLAATGAMDDGDAGRIDTVDTSTSAPVPTSDPIEAGPAGVEAGPSGGSTTSTDRATLAVGPDSATTGSGPDATTTTTVSTVDGPASEPRATDERTEQVARFRELVAAEALRSDPLSDQDIEDLAVALCVIAKVEDTTGFATARAKIATDQAVAGGLTAEQLSGTINAAVRAFCPTDAVRLGL